jgi:hypothetical protein
MLQRPETDAKLGDPRCGRAGNAANAGASQPGVGVWVGESETTGGFRALRAAGYALLFGVAIVLPLWIAATAPRILASSYGARFAVFELMGFCVSSALAIVAGRELLARRPLSWRVVLPIALPLLVTLDAVTYFSELARKPFDYDCYEYAGRALLLGEDPYRVGLNYLYPPLTAQVFAASARAAAWIGGGLGFAPSQDGVWDAVFYLYQCAQIGLVAALYFLCCRVAAAFGLASPWGPLLVAVLLLFDNPLLRTLRHGQINLWVLATSANGRTSAPVPSSATTTATRSTRRPSARGRSSAATRRSSRPSRSARAPTSAPEPP